MLEPAIRDFVIEKIREKQPDSSCSEEDCRNWLIERSKEACQRRFSTHVPKFIHPDVKVDGFFNMIVKADRQNDGYIKTANVPEAIDSYGNAAVMAVTDLLALEINGKPLYEHLAENTEDGENFINFFGEDKEKIKENFTASLNNNIASTDSRIRQVFFPVNSREEYRIITPLMSSPVMKRLADLQEAGRKYNNNPLCTDEKVPKKAWELESRGEYLEKGYWTLFDTVDISYGGSKTQNISSFNKTAKSFKLLKSMPPQIRKRKIRIPQENFFKESVYVKTERYRALFSALDRIFKVPVKNKKIKKTRDNYYYALLEEIAADIASVRDEICLNESSYKGCLSDAEYTMLYEDKKRYESDDWLYSISERFARWFCNTYEKSGLVNSPLIFADEEIRYVRDFAYSNKEKFIQ